MILFLVATVGLFAGISDAQDCSDRMVGNKPWHDVGGAKYDCIWYGERSNRCEKYGEKYAWEDMTASIACCSCNGGVVLGEESTAAAAAGSKKDLFELTVVLRLHNLTESDMTFPMQMYMEKSISLVLGIERKNLDPQFSSMSVKQLEKSKAPTPAPSLQIDRGIARTTSPGSLAPGSSSPGAGRRPGSGGFGMVGPSSSYTGGKYEFVREALDIPIKVKVQSITAFRENWNRSIRKNFMKNVLKRKMPTLGRVTIGARLTGPTCLDNCFDAREREEDGVKCYCSEECEKFGDCCPSFFALPCVKTWHTWSPTPRGPGAHWNAENQKWAAQYNN